MMPLKWGEKLRGNRTLQPGRCLLARRCSSGFSAGSLTYSPLDLSCITCTNAPASGSCGLASLWCRAAAMFAVLSGC